MSFSPGNRRLMPHIGSLLMIGNGLVAVRHIPKLFRSFELRGNSVFVTQQIEADIHHGGRAAGATLNIEKKTLIVRAVEFDSPKGHCCPTYISVVAFRWTGSRFQQVSSRQVPIPSSGK